MNFSKEDFHIEVSGSIEEVKDAWREFNSHMPQCDPTYLKALEVAKPFDMKFRYLTVRMNGQVIATAYLQLVEFSGSNFNDKGSLFLVPILKFLFSIKKVRLLFCGNLFSIDLPYLQFNHDLIRFDDVIQILRDVTAKENCSLLMIKELVLSDVQLQHLLNSGFRKYVEDLTMAMNIDAGWKSFSDYSSSLTKKYKKRLKRIRLARENLILKCLSESEIKSYLPEIGRLFQQTVSRQFLKMGIIDENYFAVMKASLGDRFFMNGYFSGDELIAFASHVEHDDLLEVHYIGINYKYNTDYFLYFNILYDGVEEAIKRKKRILELGRTAREAKAIVGCKPFPSHDYLYVRNPIINFFIGLFESMFLKGIGDTWKDRHPLKTSTGNK